MNTLASFLFAKILKFCYNNFRNQEKEANKMDMRILLAFSGAAEELARTPLASQDQKLQRDICAKYGIFLDTLNQDELDELSRLVEDFIYD